jgi:DNA invertase Pin-like site-specific DNA recombinase
MLDQIRPGDVIVVWKLDRLARSTRDLLNTMDTINEAGGKFQSLSEPWANTTNHAGKMIMTVFAGIAEFERDLIRERTGAGREAAKQRGVRFGRPRKLILIRRRLQPSCLRKARRFETSQGRSTYTKPRFIAWLLLRDFGFCDCFRTVPHQTLHTFSLTIGCPTLQENAC